MSFQISRGGVEIVDSVSHCYFDHRGHLLLVEDVLAVLVLVGVEPHGAVAQKSDAVQVLDYVPAG